MRNTFIIPGKTTLIVNLAQSCNLLARIFKSIASAMRTYNATIKGWNVDSLQIMYVWKIQICHKFSTVTYHTLYGRYICCNVTIIPQNFQNADILQKYMWILKKHIDYKLLFNNMHNDNIIRCLLIKEFLRDENETSSSMLNCFYFLLRP